MSSISIPAPRRVASTFTILIRQRATATILPDSTLIQLDSATPTPKASIPNTSNPSASGTNSRNTCTTDSDCANDTTCLGGNCVSTEDTGLIGSAPEATSQLDTPTAVGIGVGVAVFVVLLIALCCWFFKSRTRQPSPLPGRVRSQSNATTFTVDNDQKTLVASMPNSPQYTAFGVQHAMPMEFYVGMGAPHDRRMSEEEVKKQPVEDGVMEKGPTAPNKALPPAPVQKKRYALDVNINKSMLFDEEATRMIRESTKPRELVPKYRFKEVLPPIPTEGRRSVAQQTISSRNSSEYELDRLPTLNEPPKIVSWLGDDLEDQDRPHLVDRRTSALSRLEGGGPPTLSLLDLRPPSPSFSFRSYDWYQDIIGDQTTFESPTTPTLPHRSPARTVNPLAANPPNLNSNFLSVPPSPGLPSPRLASHLHPNLAAGMVSPTNPNFRLSPTVYQIPMRSSVPEFNSGLSSPQDQTAYLSSKSRRTSRVQSQMTQRTHSSSSWLPEEGFYSPEDGTQDIFDMYARRPSAPGTGRPDSYSPLT